MATTTMLSCSNAFTTPMSSIPFQQQQQQQWQKRQRGILKMSDYNGDDDEKPADVVGAKFFGGSAVKDELFDLEEEESALELLKKESTKEKEEEEEEDDISSRVYNRFEDEKAFPDDVAKKVALGLQLQINDVLNDDDDDDVSSSSLFVQYSKASFQWNTPFRKSASSPFEELKKAKEFYNRANVAILSASSSSTSSTKNEMSLRWEISLLWPSPWEPHVLLTGTSKLTFAVKDDDSITILSQTDYLDNGGKSKTDIYSALSNQLLPRFWDLYHIGMTPAAEKSPLLPPSKASAGFLAPYELYELPPRLYCTTTLPSSKREYREADVIPNHAFVTAIKTMGPNKQTYTPVSPIQVSINRVKEPKDEGGGSKNEIEWNIPLSPQFTCNPTLPLPSLSKKRGETCTYKYNPSSKLIATVPYNKSVQDEDISSVRKTLYDAVIKDGLKPKISDVDGRPKFFVFQNDVKACFTKDGMGMAVYEWRPDFAKGNVVGIELEM